jgi:hypothetical protein
MAVQCSLSLSKCVCDNRVSTLLCTAAAATNKKCARGAFNNLIISAHALSLAKLFNRAIRRFMSLRSRDFDFESYYIMRLD